MSALTLRAFSCALVLLAQTALAQTDGDAIAEHFRAGQRAAAAQNFDIAITEFKTVLKLDPTLTEARANLGLMYYSKAQFDEAAAELLQVVRAEPKLLPGQLFLGLSYINSGKPRQAIQPLRGALQLDPANAEARRALLLSYLEQEQYTDATEQLATLEKQPADEETLYAVAQAYLTMGKSLTAALATHFSNSAWAHRLAGDLAADREDWPAALESYRKSVALDPAMSSDLQPSLANVLQKLGKQDGAVAGQASTAPPLDCNAGRLERCERLLAADPRPELYYRLIRADTALGSLYFAKLQQAFPDSARAHEVQAQIARLRQDFPSAISQYQLALQKRPDDAELHRNIGEVLLLLDRISESEVHLQQADKLSPRNPQTEYLLAQVALKRQDTETAIVHLERALQRDPSLPELHARLGTAYMHVGRPALAAPELEKAQPIDYHGDLAFQLFKAYRALGNSAAADKALARSKQLRKGSLQSAVSKISGETAIAEQQAASQ